jgi:hypothetical protein
MTPEHFLRRFERHLSQNPGDQQMSLGVQISRHRQRYDLQLSQYDDKGWRATFYTTGMEHAPTSATGTGWERTPWHATQRAAWEALKRVQTTESGARAG